MPALRRAFTLLFSSSLLACASACGTAKTPDTTPDAGTTTPTPDAGSEPTPDAGTPPGAGPILTISSPLANATLMLGADADETLKVRFSVENFTLMSEGACAGAATCGHVKVTVDDNACLYDGDTENDTGYESPIEAYIRSCPTGIGPHDVTLALVGDDGHAVKNSGQPVTATVHVNLTENTQDPAIGITSPTSAATVHPDANGDVPVTVQTERLTLMATGTCGATANCGHLRIFVDGDACNGNALANSEGVSPIAAHLAKCDSQAGDHGLTVEVWDDTGSPLHDQYGNKISDFVFVTAD